MMRPALLSTALALALAALAACNPPTATPDASTVADQPAKAGAEAAANPLLAPWTGPYGGVPPFGQMQVKDVKPAMETAIAAHLKELDAIAAQTEPATFDNTLVAIERSGELITRAQVFFELYSSSLSTPEFRAVEAEVAPMLADYQSRMVQNEKLFQRIQAVRDGAEFATLRPDQQRLVQVTHDFFRSMGAQLSGEARERYSAINKELASLYTQFSNNVLADEEGYVTYLDATQLGGLPESFTKSAAALAERLYARGAEFSPQALALAEQTVSIPGFMAPPLKPDAAFFVLTKLPMSVCPFCDSELTWPTDIVLVRLDAPQDWVDFNQRILVTGTLALGTEIDADRPASQRFYRKACLLGADDACAPAGIR